jgi:hypothetical protein
MSQRYKELIMLVVACVGTLALFCALVNDFMHARRFVRYGVEKQGTILTLDHEIVSRSPVHDFVYSLQIDENVIVKKFPYNWLLPRKRSFLVLSDSPGPDDIALGNSNSSSLTVLCYMEGCDVPDRRLFYLFIFVLLLTALPVAAVRLIRNWDSI